MIKQLLIKLSCWYHGHKWTCNAKKGIPATEQQRKSWEGFRDYAKMYCDRCGKVSELNKRIQ